MHTWTNKCPLCGKAFCYATCEVVTPWTPTQAQIQSLSDKIDQMILGKLYGQLYKFRKPKYKIKYLYSS